MIIIVYLPIPKYLSSPLNLKRISTGEIQHIKKPDISNIEKAVEDGCEGIVYNNDSQITSKVSKKYYSQTPNVLVEFTHIDKSFFDFDKHKPSIVEKD